MTHTSRSVRGRGASSNPTGRFERLSVELDEPATEGPEKVLNRVRSLRGGKLNDSRFHRRFHAQGPFAEQVRGLFKLGCRRHGVGVGPPELSAAAFRRPGGDQLSLFDAE